jgi:hypothetical protein
MRMMNILTCWQILSGKYYRQRLQTFDLQALSGFYIEICGEGGINCVDPCWGWLNPFNVRSFHSPQFCLPAFVQTEFGDATKQKCPAFWAGTLNGFAVREGFEPSVQFPVRQFSKLILSASQAPHLYQ